MELNTLDYLKKALLDTQEQVRDFMEYSSKVEHSDLKDFFEQCALSEGRQAQKLQDYVNSYEARKL
jgi:hypothetical protein